MGLRLMDDDFMKVCLKDNPEAVELIAKTFIMRSDIKIIEVNTQMELKNLYGRSVILDILAVDANGRLINIEFQNGKKDDIPRRARYYHSIIAANALKSGQSIDELPETYVVFLLAKADKRLMGGQAVQIFNNHATIGGEDIYFNDGAHTVLVDCSYKGEDDIGRLIHDILCSDPRAMNNKILAETTARFKFKEEGVREMCAIFEEIRRESYDAAEKKATADTSMRIAMNFINSGEKSIEKIAMITGMSISEVEELKAECDKQKA